MWVGRNIRKGASSSLRSFRGVSGFICASSLTYENVIPNSREPYHVSTFSSLPSSSSPELAFDVPNDISAINESNVDLGHESHIFTLLGGNNENFESMGYFRGYDAALDPYCIDLVDLPRKLMLSLIHI